MGESRLVNRIQKALVARGAWVFKVHGSPLQRRGVPDLVGCYQGRFLALEGKMPGEQPTPIQEWTMAQIGAAGGLAVPVWSLDDAFAALSQLGGSNVCAITPLREFDVSVKSLEITGILMDRAKAVLSEDQVYAIACELGFAEGITLVDHGQLQVNLTPLQHVALGAACAAAAECGGRMVDA